MDDIRLRLGRAKNRSTAVPDLFIDEYMVDADGEFVKIYLYLLRCLGRADGSFSVSEMADRLNHTERDIKRALKYWEKRGLLTLEYSGDELTGLTLTDLTGEKEKLIQKQHDPSEIAAAVSSDEDIEETLRACEVYLGRPLTQPESQKFFSWYRDLHMSAALISYLVESCMEAGHRDFSYMNAVALRWTEKGFRTPAEAEAYGKVYSSTYYAVMKAFGISGRTLSDAETDYVDKWVGELSFSDGIIAEACRKTILRTGGVNFRYADSILGNWKKAGVASLSDIEALDRKHGMEKPEKRSRDFSVKMPGRGTGKAAPSGTVSGSVALNPKIHNFPEHDYDFDAIERKKLLN